jgi:hypothetical protein
MSILTSSRSARARWSGLRDPGGSRDEVGQVASAYPHHLILRAGCCALSLPAGISNHRQSGLIRRRCSSITTTLAQLSIVLPHGQIGLPQARFPATSTTVMRQ